MVGTSVVPIRIIEILSTTPTKVVSVSLSLFYTHTRLLCIIIIIIRYLDLHRSYYLHYCGILITYLVQSVIAFVTPHIMYINYTPNRINRHKIHTHSILFGSIQIIIYY